MRVKLSFVLAVFIGLASISVSAESKWDRWVSKLRVEALEQGIRPGVFDMAFENVKPSRSVISLDKNQPETRLTFEKYRRSRIDPYRIKLGVIKYNKYRAQLEKIGAEYGVNPCMITAFWGIESSYGHFKGTFPVIASLATLAFDGRRSDFFRKELLLALHILNGNHITLNEFKGEWAGASGHSQFLPSSWQRYAVDYDGDGRKDIWNNLDDVFASIANYVKSNGWQSGEPWGVEVELPMNFDPSVLKAEETLPLSEWISKGVRIKPGFEIPNKDLDATILEQYGGPVFLMFKNYSVILKYNNSRFYAASVGYLSDSICKRVAQ